MLLNFHLIYVQARSAFYMWSIVSAHPDLDILHFEHLSKFCWVIFFATRFCVPVIHEYDVCARFSPTWIHILVLSLSCVLIFVLSHKFTFSIMLYMYFTDFTSENLISFVLAFPLEEAGLF